MAHTYSTNTLTHTNIHTFEIYIKREVRNIPNKWILVLWIIFLFSSSTSLFFPVQRGLCQSFILISSALWYRSCIYTSTEQSIIRLISIMCSSKNNSNAKKLCNWINESRCHTVENVDKSAFERKLKTEEFKIIKTHTHSHAPHSQAFWMVRQVRPLSGYSNSEIRLYGRIGTWAIKTMPEVPR